MAFACHAQGRSEKDQLPEDHVNEAVHVSLDRETEIRTVHRRQMGSVDAKGLGGQESAIEIGAAHAASLQVPKAQGHFADSTSHTVASMQGDLLTSSKPSFAG